MNRRVMVNNKVHWPQIRSSIVERIKEGLTFLFIMFTFLLWLIVLNA